MQCSDRMKPRHIILKGDRKPRPKRLYSQIRGEIKGGAQRSGLGRRRGNVKRTAGGRGGEAAPYPLERNEPYQRSRAAAAAGISPPLPGMSRVKCLAPKKYLYFRSFMKREGIDEIGKQVTLSFSAMFHPRGFFSIWHAVTEQENRPFNVPGSIEEKRQKTKIIRWNQAIPADF